MGISRPPASLASRASTPRLRSERAKDASMAVVRRISSTDASSFCSGALARARSRNRRAKRSSVMTVESFPSCKRSKGETANQSLYGSNGTKVVGNQILVWDGDIETDFGGHHQLNHAHRRQA